MAPPIGAIALRLEDTGNVLRHDSLPSGPRNRHPRPVLRIRLLAATALLLALPDAARADMQCEGRLIGYGASIDEVLQLCGPPLRRVSTERIVYGGLADSPYTGVERIPVEVWTYEPPGEFTRRLVFVAGRLERVQTGGYADLQ
jgi:hypothetical protein